MQAHCLLGLLALAPLLAGASPIPASQAPMVTPLHAWPHHFSVLDDADGPLAQALRRSPHGFASFLTWRDFLNQQLWRNGLPVAQVLPGPASDAADSPAQALAAPAAVSPAPEPVSLALVGLALAGLALARRRQPR